MNHPAFLDISQPRWPLKKLWKGLLNCSLKSLKHLANEQEFERSDVQSKGYLTIYRNYKTIIIYIYHKPASTVLLHGRVKFHKIWQCYREKAFAWLRLPEGHLSILHHELSPLWIWLPHISGFWKDPPKTNKQIKVNNSTSINKNILTYLLRSNYLVGYCSYIVAACRSSGIYIIDCMCSFGLIQIRIRDPRYKGPRLYKRFSQYCFVTNFH